MRTSAVPGDSDRETGMLTRCATMTMAGLGVLSCAAVGCTVRPQLDYERTGDMVKRHTGSTEVYDPAADAMINDRVSSLLHDGLTVEEAVRVALLKNPEFQALFEQIGASRADVVQSGLLSNPTVSLAVRFPEGGGLADLTLGLAQEIVDLWQIPVRKEVTGNELEQLVLNVVQRGVEIAGETRIDCYRLLAARKAEEIARENVELVERSLKLTEKRVNGGETSRIDADLVRATLLAAKLALQTVQRDRQVAWAALARTIGLSRWAQPWELVDVLPAPAAISNDDAGLLAYGLVERMDARAKEKQVAAAEAELKRQWLNIFPSIQLGAELERFEQRALPGRTIPADTARASVAAGQLTAPTIESRGQRALARRQIIDSIVGPSIQATLPIWDQNQAQIAKAGYVVQQRRKEYESLLDAVASDIQESAAIARVAGQQVRFYDDEILPQADSNVRVSERAYEAGEQGVLVLLEAQQFLVNQRREYVNFWRDYAVAYAALERAVGGRMPGMIEPATTQSAGTN